uniref:Uncharacterized protein n=1 Tax=Lutzomyia longipalpis TaxID=7200 RepID=A0A1B0CNK3_LUTLO
MKKGSALGETIRKILEQLVILITFSATLLTMKTLTTSCRKLAVAVAGVVQKKLESKMLKSSSIPTSTGFFTLSLDQDIFKRYDVTKIFTDREIPNLLITIHQLKHPQENVFYSNLIGVWNILDSKYPVKILSSWSDISHVLVHKSSPDMIISASLDGSMSLWDVREYLQGQDDEKVLGQAPCQLIIPKILGNCFEIGRIVSLKCIEWKSESDFFMDFSPIQVCSLHEDGILIIWLLIETSSAEPTFSINASAHDHAFSKAKLVQSNLFDLRPFLMEDRTTKSNFERRLSYFEGDLFSDTALKELQDKDGEKDSNSEILCTDFEALTEGYFVATNRPFLLYFNKSPKKDCIVKIPVEDGDCKLHPTVLQVCPLRENLLIGFSDGSVKLKPIVFESDGAWGGVEAKVAEEEVEESNLSAKSCAIQNIVKNERKLYQESQALSNLDSTEMRKTFASHVSLQRKDVRIGGPILGGSYFRRGFVRKIQMTRKHIFALCGNNLKGFNLSDYEEVQMEMENMNIVDIGSTSDGLLKSRLT